jgi:hypothetical protein
MDEKWLKKFFLIDDENIYGEMQDHAYQYMLICDKHARSLKKLKQLKDRESVVEAELTTLAYSDSNKILGTTKPTVNMVNSFVVQHQKYREVKSELIEAEYKEQFYRNAVFGMSQKGNMIEKLGEFQMKGVG